MFGRKYEFKPDRTDSGTLSKLYVTKRQRLALLKWLLIGACLLVLSLVQDVVMSRMHIFGATTDLVAGGILLCCMLLGVDSSAIFALCASTAFYFAGFAPGVYTIALLTALGVFANILRHSYLRKSVFSIVFCAGTALMVYELVVFVIAMFLEYTTFARIGIVCLGGLVTVALMPVMYPVFLSVSKIGGEAWKE